MTTAATEPAPATGSNDLGRPESRSPSRAPRLYRVLRVVGIGALLVPITIHVAYPYALSEESLGALTLVIGRTIPKLADLATTCTIAGVVLVATAPFVGSWPASTGWRFVARVLSPLSILVTLLSALFAWLMLSFGQANFAVVWEPSPTGCRIVVAQSANGFHHETSHIGVLPRGATLVDWRVRDITTDLGGFNPDSELEVQWDGSLGTVPLGTLGHGAEPFDSVTVACQ